MLRKNTHIHKIVLIALYCLTMTAGFTSIYVWFLAAQLGLVLLIPALVLTVFCVVCAVLSLFALRIYRKNDKYISESESHKISIVQENIRISQAMKAWIITLRNFADKYPDVKETLDSFEKVVRDVDVPGEVYGVMEKVAHIGHKARKTSRHNGVHKGA